MDNGRCIWQLFLSSQVEIRSRNGKIPDHPIALRFSKKGCLSSPVFLLFLHEYLSSLPSYECLGAFKCKSVYEHYKFALASSVGVAVSQQHSKIC